MKEILLAAVCLSACTGAPSREKFPGPPGRTTEVQQAQTQKAVMGGIDPLNNPLVASQPSHAGPNDGAAPDTSRTLQGVVELPKGVSTEGKFFFVAIRPADGGPPLAVRKETEAKFPYKFSMSAADVMIPGTPFEGNVTVTARLKQDPNPLSHQPGDYSASVNTKIGDTGVKLTLRAD